MTRQTIDAEAQCGTGSSFWRKFALVAVLPSCIIAPAVVASDRGSSVSEDYAAFLRARSGVAPLSVDDMFGDRIGLFTGSVEFLQVDVSIPGNGPEVAIKRRIKAGTQAIQGLGMFGAWDMAIPSIHGLFSTQGGWRNYTVADPFKRCSIYTAPADETISHSLPTANGGITMKRTFHAEEFWHGTFLYLPETGDEELLSNNDHAWPAPTNGYTYGLRTKSGSAIRCIVTEDGTGEGFEVTTPVGITYRLDHMAAGIGLTPLIKPPYDFSTQGPGWPASDYEYVLYRQEFFLLPTSAHDRFGNSVTYSWDAANPKQLTRIASSDGRVLDITWNNGTVSQVKHGDKVWTYSSNGNRVTFPDQSYRLVGSPAAASRGTGSVPAEHSSCVGPGDPGMYNTISTSMTHPSGAVATFTFKSILHGRSWSTYSCRLGYPIPGDEYNGSYELHPAKYYTWSLTSKTISGPGITTPYTWTYTYGPHNGCYSGTDRGSLSCQESSPTTKWVDVLDPSGVTTRYTFGNRHNVNDGYLLGISKPGQTVVQSYQLDSPGTYPVFAGGVTHSRGVFATKLVPLLERIVEQQGTKFTWRVNSFDGQARPLSITRSSVPIATAPTAPPIPAVPTLAVPGTLIAGTQYQATWAAVSGATRYIVERSFNSGAYGVVYDGSGMSVSLSAAAAGSLGHRAKACNTSGCSAYSAVASASVTAPPPSIPGAPTLTVPSSVTAGTAYTVSWSASAGATRYVLEHARGTNAFTVAYDGAATSLSKTTIGANNPIRHRVQACNASGCSAYSAEKTTTVTGSVSPPGGGTCVPGEPCTIEP